MSLEEKLIELTQEEHEIMLLMDKYPQIAMLLLINYVEIVVSMILGKGVYWYVKGKDGKTGGKSSRKDGCSYC